MEQGMELLEVICDRPRDSSNVLIWRELAYKQYLLHSALTSIFFPVKDPKIIFFN